MKSRVQFDVRPGGVLLLALLYLPVSAALTWCYERGGSVWGCVLLHGGLNGLTLFMTL